MDVTALVGPAGTGKSHRASFVARAYGCSHIVDDGLLIREGHIVAGRSAKKEDNAMGAVRRAIFADAAHAADVRDALLGERPAGVLVLGTSLNMVHRIVDALDLPRPDRVVDIADIATDEEIRRARRIRRTEGKHVIPAPTFEVRKSFSGYMVDPLRFLARSGTGAGADREGPVIEKSMVRPTFSALGRFFIADMVVGAIAERACREVDGVVEARRGRVEMSEHGVHVAVDLTLRLGAELPEVLRAAQLRARAVVEEMTALHVLRMDVIARRVVAWADGDGDAAARGAGDRPAWRPEAGGAGERPAPASGQPGGAAGGPAGAAGGTASPYPLPAEFAATRRGGGDGGHQSLPEAGVLQDPDAGDGRPPG